MLYPLLRKRILRRIREAFENVILNKVNHHKYKTYERWLEEYFNLSEQDHINILTKVERAQSAAIIYAMRTKDREIFINQLGCFYIKQTTIDFYNALEKLIGDKSKEEYDYEEVKQSALEETRANFIRRANYKRDTRNGKATTITFK